MEFNNRILLVDDNRDIHRDFRKVLEEKQDIASEDLESLVDALFDEGEEKPRRKVQISFEIDSAYQGQEAFEMVTKAEQEGNPYALVFMDIRMPPGWDGIQTIKKIWEKYRYTEVIIVTAYSDYSWDDMVEKLGLSDKLLYIKKPFDALTVKQLAVNLTRKWNTAAKLRFYIHELDREIGEKKRALDRLLENL